MTNSRALPSLLALACLMGSCAYSVHQNHISDFRPYKDKGAGQIVKVDVKDHVIFADTSSARFVDRAYAQLLASCPGGKIAAVSTLHSTALGFFSWHNRLRLKGLCLSMPSNQK